MSDRYFQEMAARCGWSPVTQTTVLLRYIDGQKSPEAFKDFLDGQEAEEKSFETDEEDEDPHEHDPHR